MIRNILASHRQIEAGAVNKLRFLQHPHQERCDAFAGAEAAEQEKVLMGALDGVGQVGENFRAQMIVPFPESVELMPRICRNRARRHGFRRQREGTGVAQTPNVTAEQKIGNMAAAVFAVMGKAQTPCAYYVYVSGGIAGCRNFITAMETQPYCAILQTRQMIGNSLLLSVGISNVVGGHCALECCSRYHRVPIPVLSQSVLG